MIFVNSADDPMIEKLPKWAQEFIARQQRKLDEALARAADVRVGLSRHLGSGDDFDTVAEVSHFRESANAVELGKGTRIRFYLTTGSSVRERAYIEVRAEGPRVNVTGSTALRIIPRISNGVQIEVAE